MDTNKQKIFEFYTTSGNKINTGPFVYVFENRNPTGDDINYPIQKFWLNTTNSQVWILTSFSTITGVIQANWTLVSSGSGGGSLSTLTGDDAVIVSPVGGNINVVGKASGAFITQSDGPGTLQGQVLVDGTTITVNGANRLTTTQKSSFYASLTADIPNATGNGAIASLTGWTEDFDLLANFNPTTGVFTAPYNGVYQFNMVVAVSNLSVAMTSASYNLVQAGSVSRTHKFAQFNPWPIANSSGVASNSGSTVLSLSAGDTVIITVQISNGAGNTASIEGANRQTFFSGFLIQRT